MTNFITLKLHFLLSITVYLSFCFRCNRSRPIKVKTSTKINFKSCITSVQLMATNRIAKVLSVACQLYYFVCKNNMFWLRSSHFFQCNWRVWKKINTFLLMTASCFKVTRCSHFIKSTHWIFIQLFSFAFLRRKSYIFEITWGWVIFSHLSQLFF